MSDTSAPTSSVEPGTTTALNWPLFCRLAAEFSATTDEARAELVRTSRSTLLRWKSGQAQPGVDRAMEIADQLNVAVTDLWIPRATGNGS